jgi:cobalt/nickel transport system permease protein
MAVIGSLVAWAVYRIGAGASSLTSRRRVVAAAVAGYAGINASALLAAIEFGLQPVLFHDSGGAPLYAPYPLAVAIPAMMLGHLTVAGFAELFVSGGLVAWMQRSEPGLLRMASGMAADTAEPQPVRGLWAALGILLMLTPLGILAVGTAWGEWSPSDFSDPHGRKAMASASLNKPAPAEAPRGLARLSTIWTAPFPDYAPPLLKNPQLGYALSAMLGVGLIIMTVQGAGWISERWKG